jgi:uncharacterized membrane protein
MLYKNEWLFKRIILVTFIIYLFDFILLQLFHLQWQLWSTIDHAISLSLRTGGGRRFLHSRT